MKWATTSPLSSRAGDGSTGGMRSGGSRSCVPMTRSGTPTGSPNTLIGIEEVFEARMALGDGGGDATEEPDLELELLGQRIHRKVTGERTAAERAAHLRRPARSRQTLAKESDTLRRS